MVEDRDLDVLVRRLAPVADEQLDWVAPAALSQAAMAEAVMAEIVTIETTGRRRLGRSQPLRRWRAGRAAVASVATAAALALVVAGLGSDDGAEVNQVTLTMRAAAQTAASASGPSVAAGDYEGWLHLRGESTSVILLPARDGGARFPATLSAVYDDWVRADGSGRSRTTWGEMQFATDAGRAAWESAGRPIIMMPAMSPHPLDTHEFGPGEYPAGRAGEYRAGDLAGLPTDAAGLEAELRRRVAAELQALPPDAAMVPPQSTWDLEDLFVFEAAVKLLRPGLLDPARRASLFEVVSSVDGISVIGPTTDAAGREGTGISYTDPVGTQVRFLFNPETSVLLGEDQTLPDPPGDPGGAAWMTKSSVMYHPTKLADTPA